MSGRMKFGVGVVSLLVIILALVSVSNAQYPIKPFTPEEEARYVVLQQNENELLPNPELVSKIAKIIVKIRKETDVPEVRKIRNNGVWFLGRVHVTNYSPTLKQKIEQSEYGPLKEVQVSKGNKKDADLIFTRPFNPVELSRRLNKEFGAQATEVRYDDKIPYLGRITINNPGEYSFYESCDCRDYRFWTFKVDEPSFKIKLDSGGMVG